MFNLKIFILTAIFLTALVLRFYQFEAWFEWGGNQSLYSWELRQLVAGHPTLVGFDAAAIGGLRFPPFQLYMLAIPFFLSGGNPAGINTFLIVLGAVTTVTFYFVGKAIFGQRVAMVSALIYTFSLHTVTVDRKFNGSTFMVIVSLLTIGFLYKLLNSEKLKFWHFIILGTIIGLGFSMHYQTIFLLIAALIVLIWQKKLKLFSINFLVFVATIIVWFLPLLIFDIRHGFFNLKGLFLLQESYTTHGLTLSGFTQSAQYFIQNFSAIAAKPFYFTNLQNFLNPAVLFLFALSLTFFPLLFKSDKKTQTLLIFFVLLSFLGFAGLAFYARSTYNYDYYYWFLIPVFVFVLAKIVNWFFELKLGYLAVLVLAFFLLTNLWLFSKYKAPDSYKIFSTATAAILIDSKQNSVGEIVVKFGEIHPGQLDYIFFRQSEEFKIASENIVLVADNDLFIERTIVKAPPPVRILGKSNGANFIPKYLFEKSFEEKSNLQLIFEEGKYKVYKLL